VHPSKEEARTRPTPGGFASCSILVRLLGLPSLAFGSSSSLLNVLRRGDRDWHAGIDCSFDYLV